MGHLKTRCPLSFPKSLVSQFGLYQCANICPFYWYSKSSLNFISRNTWVGLPVRGPCTHRGTNNSVTHPLADTRLKQQPCLQIHSLAGREIQSEELLWGGYMGVWHHDSVMESVLEQVAKELVTSSGARIEDALGLKTCTNWIPCENKSKVSDNNSVRYFLSSFVRSWRA